ncbi:MAG: DegV family protein [Pseudomonadota bacterium]
MTNATAAITQIDADALASALRAGIVSVLERRDYINSINVFPVPDSDTGTNLAFTLASVHAAIERPAKGGLSELLDRIAESAINGARGNSGAIMAQYFQGLNESGQGADAIDAKRLSSMAADAARSAWTAMSNPVPGTLPTVLEDFADELVRRAGDGVEDIRLLFRQGLDRARRSLAQTPDQLAVLKDAGVVDAGAQGFVDMLDGIWGYMRTGKEPALPKGTGGQIQHEPVGRETSAPEEHRFCTECLLEGEDLDIAGLRAHLESMDASSLVVAGGRSKARIHIHTDSPGDVFRVCNEYGEIRQQKADDMAKQHGLMNQRGQVAIVTDSAADLPADEMERLGIHMVPVRLIFDNEEFLDKLTITPAEFYAKLAASELKPQTSQPPPADFRRQFELLTSHGLDVLAVQLSGALSGTRQASEAAAKLINKDAEAERVQVFDTFNAACGQALMVLWAAEAAARGWDRADIVDRLQEQIDDFKTYALVRDLSWGVRGGRIKPWMETVSQKLSLNPVLTASSEGLLKACSVIPGKKKAVERFARFLLRKMKGDACYRIMISHTNARDDARTLRDLLLAGHPEVDACWLEEASPAVGAHAGPGSLIVGLHPWSKPEKRNG